MSKTMPMLGALAIGLVASIAVAKTEKIDPKRMTCAEFVALTEGVKPHVIAYLEGYDQGGKAGHTVSMAVPAATEVKYVEQGTFANAKLCDRFPDMLAIAVDLAEIAEAWRD